MTDTELAVLAIGVAADHSLDAALRARAKHNSAESEASAKRMIEFLRLEARIKSGRVTLVGVTP